jgi:small ligand-binding sensory domain FIST
LSKGKDTIGLANEPMVWGTCNVIGNQLIVKEATKNVVIKIVQETHPMVGMFFL